MKDKKNILIVVLILAIAGISYYLLTSESRYYQKLEKQLIEMGTDFYTNFYYEQMKDNEEHFSPSGIPVSLLSLRTYGLDISDFKNRETGQACDEENTLALVKFKEGTKDYKTDFYIEPVLKCE